MKKHLNIRITGRVQGVFFRSYLRENARKLGISGFAENMPDGSVYAEAEGEEADLAEFLGLSRSGPYHARVGKIEHDFGPIKNFKEFDVGW